MSSRRKPQSGDETSGQPAAHSHYLQTNYHRSYLAQELLEIDRSLVAVPIASDNEKQQRYRGTIVAY